jgi:hypothetical protein
MEIKKLSKQGNDALRKEDYKKAFFFWSEILQIDQKIPTLLFSGELRVLVRAIGTEQSLIGIKLLSLIQISPPLTLIVEMPINEKVNSMKR